MHKAVMVVALLGVGCGSGGAGAEDAAGQARPATAGTHAQDTGRVHEVRMLVTSDGRYVYEPVSLEIQAGDRVRWINVSGGPHNVAFYDDLIPDGAADVLRAAMPDQMTPLVGRLLFEQDEVYEVSFAGAPPGTYEYYCTPHEMLGMVAELRIGG